MSAKNLGYEAWEERMICQEKGKRVVHYYLKSTSGRSLLAVVGTERSLRHMAYVVTNEFLEAYGSNTSINRSLKWGARRDVVSWLISLVRNDGPPTTKSNINLVPKNKGKGHSSSEKKEENFTQEVPTSKVAKKLRTSGAHQRLESSDPDKQIATGEPACQKLKIKFASKKPIGIQLVEPEPHRQAFPKVGEKIELLCQDSGMRGCWFRCKVLKASEKRLKVQYNDVEDVEGSGKLEEWVPASRVAAPDKLSMRYSDRLTIRPWPPVDLSNSSFEVGAAVDAWWSDGWWEGVVTGVLLSRSDNVHVYLPGEGKFLTLQRKDIRTSRDWIDNRWVDIKPKPDVLSFICSYLKPKPKPPTSSTVDKASKLGSSADREVPTNSKPKAVEEKTKELPCPSIAENVEKMKKRLRISKNNEFGRGSSSADGGAGNQVKSVSKTKRSVEQRKKSSCGSRQSKKQINMDRRGYQKALLNFVKRGATRVLTYLILNLQQHLKLKISKQGLGLGRAVVTSVLKQ